MNNTIITACLVGATLAIKLNESTPAQEHTNILETMMLAEETMKSGLNTWFSITESEANAAADEAQKEEERISEEEER